VEKTRPKQMLNIRNILSTLYANRSAEELYIWLEEQNLLESFKRVIAQLNSVIQEENALLNKYQSLPVGHIAGNLLCAVNKRIGAEGSPEKAKEMENTLGDICLAILLSFLDSIKSNKTIVWEEIIYALRDTCDFHNYDFNQLIQFLKIDTTTSYWQSHRSADQIIKPQAIPSLCWKGHPTQLKDFLDIFINQKLIRNRKGLFKLFENPTTALQLQFEPALADLIVQLFYTIKNRKLAGHLRCDGFYLALEFHILDFKKFFLKNQDAGRRINALKQSKVKWRDNQLRIDRWLKDFSLSNTVHRTVH
jgi:hypothetical protein